MPKTSKQTGAARAEEEYERLLSRYREAGVESFRLEICDSMIRKVAEIFGILESLKELPSLFYDKRNPANQRETAAGRMRVKYMAQYVSAMQKLNRELLGTAEEEDGELDEFE